MGKKFWFKLNCQSTDTVPSTNYLLGATKTRSTASTNCVEAATYREVTLHAFFLGTRATTRGIYPRLVKRVPILGQQLPDNLSRPALISLGTSSEVNEHFKFCPRRLRPRRCICFIPESKSYCVLNPSCECDILNFVLPEARSSPSLSYETALFSFPKHVREFHSITSDQSV